MSDLRVISRNWPETSCAVDFWFGLLDAWGHDADATLGFTATLDFEGDQFTFLKVSAQDLATLFGITVQELTIYRSVEAHAIEQARRGRVLLVEADAFYLPDTAATTYRTDHAKTAIGINSIDPQARTATYFHNTGHFRLANEDYDAVLRSDAPLPPYAEIVKHDGIPVPSPELRDVCRDLLCGHLRYAPVHNPITAWRQVFPDQIAAMCEGNGPGFHAYAFSTFRQLGANFELMGRLVRWLDGPNHPALQEACAMIAAEAKILQFRAARAVRARRPDDCGPVFDGIERAYDRALAGLACLS